MDSTIQEVVQRAESMKRFANGDKMFNLGAWRKWEAASKKAGMELDPQEFKRAAGSLITTRMIEDEFARTHHGEGTMLVASDFPESDLRLSLDEFSRKQGWLNNPLCTMNEYITKMRSDLEAGEQS